jgi:hypothetical protein
MQRESMSNPVPSKKLLAGVGVMSVIGACVGYNIFTCHGVPEALVWTVVMSAFFVFIPPHVWALLLILFVAAIFGTRSLASWSVFRDREPLLLVALPTACLATTYAYALISNSEQVCGFSGWR